MMLVQTAPAAAAADEDAQAWLQVGVRGQLLPQVDIAADVSARISNDRNGILTGIVRGTVSYRVSDAVSVEAFYGRFDSYDDGDVTQREHRAAQHLMWRLGQAAGGRWTARTRFEQRMVEGADLTGLRLRQRLAYRRPLAGPIDITVSGEAFLALNDTDFGSRSGFEGLRTTASVTVPIGASVGLDIGYLNQWTYRAAAPDRIVHAATATLTASF